MKVISPTWELINPINREQGIEALRFIERMARISHRSEDAQSWDSWRRFIAFVVLAHGDWSVVEHASATVVFRVNRGVTHELVRHRLFSFTQESTRFVNGRKSYPDGLEFIPSIESENTIVTEGNAAIASNVLEQAERSYLELLDRGVRPQEARSILPNALAATIAVTGNLRNWRHFLIMRTTKETHPDFRQVTLPLLACFKDRIPLLFDDIVECAKQSDNLRLPR